MTLKEYWHDLLNQLKNCDTPGKCLNKLAGALLSENPALCTKYRIIQFSSMGVINCYWNKYFKFDRYYTYPELAIMEAAGDISSLKHELLIDEATRLGKLDILNEILAL